MAVTQYDNGRVQRFMAAVAHIYPRIPSNVSIRHTLGLTTAGDDDDNNDIKHEESQVPTETLTSPTPSGPQQSGGRRRRKLMVPFPSTEDRHRRRRRPAQAFTQRQWQQEELMTTMTALYLLGEIRLKNCLEMCYSTSTSTSIPRSSRARVSVMEEQREILNMQLTKLRGTRHCVRLAERRVGVFCSGLNEEEKQDEDCRRMLRVCRLAFKKCLKEAHQHISYCRSRLELPGGPEY